MSTLKEYWQNNIKKNLKQISAYLGDILSTVFTTILFAINGGLGWSAFLFVLVIGMKPFIIMYINMVFKGQAQDLKEIAAEAQIQNIKAAAEHQKNIALLEQKIDFLNEKVGLSKTIEEMTKDAEYKREISEYRCQLAARDGKVPDAIVATKDWINGNAEIEKLEGAEQ